MAVAFQSLPDDGLMFLLVLADVLVDLEESFNLDESAFLQKIQQGACQCPGTTKQAHVQQLVVLQAP